MSDSNLAPPKILKLINDMFQSNSLHVTPILGPHFSPPYGVNVKINVRFKFGTPKNIEIDIRHVPIKQFARYPHFEPSFQPPYGADVKINVRFKFGIPKILKFMYDVFQSKTLHFYSHFGSMSNPIPEIQDVWPMSEN